jgi:hypothetical protein
MLLVDYIFVLIYSETKRYMQFALLSDFGNIKSLQINFLCNQHSTKIHRFTLGYILKHEKNGGSQYFVSAIFFVKNQLRKDSIGKSTVFCQCYKVRLIADLYNTSDFCLVLANLKPLHSHPPNS